MRARAAAAAFVLAVVAALVLRLAAIERRPLHHDEGVNALFLLDLVGKGAYKYDPSNYHGPLLYYMVAPLLLAFGKHTWVLRLWPALLGTATVGLLWPFRRLVGATGAAAAAWLLALSPVSVYFNRDLIHETWVAAAVALLAAAALAHGESGRTAPAVIAWAAAALLVATKETAPFFLAALAGGALAASLLARGLRPALGGLLAALRRGPARLLDGRGAHAWGALVATVILIVLFTSLFTNLDGFRDMFRAYMFWAKTGKEGMGHEKPWTYFFELLWRYERPAYVLGALGLLVAALRREAAAAFGVYAALLLAVHAAIPYKTPWLVLGILPALALSAGFLVDRAAAAVPGRAGPPLVLAGFAALLPLLGREAWRVSFVDYDDDRESIVYSQTRREFLELVAAIRAVALASPRGRDLAVDVMSVDHFPLNWYLRDFTAIGYWGGLGQAKGEGIVLLSRSQLSDHRRSLEVPAWTRTEPLRPGVELALVVPEPLFEAARASLPEPGRWERLAPPTPLAALPDAEVPPELEAGLVATARQVGPEGPRLLFVEPGRLPRVDFDRGESAEWTPPVEIEWEGYLHAPRPGRYLFALASDDGSTLDIDGERVVDNWGTHALERREGTVELEAGFHRVLLRYSDQGGGAKLTWTWRRPGDATEEPVPQGELAHEPAAAAP